MENALLAIPKISQHRDPMAVIAFNYRRNPEARFEYWNFRQPNSKMSEVERLRLEYGAEPIGTENVNVFGYGPELRRRGDEYRGIPTFPIHFWSEELGAEHWQILMKPPSPQTEYMDIIRDIIQKLFYEDRLTFKNLEKAHPDRGSHDGCATQKGDESTQLCRQMDFGRANLRMEGRARQRDAERLRFRMQTMTASDALKLCLIVTDLVRRTRKWRKQADCIRRRPTNTLARRNWSENWRMRSRRFGTMDCPSSLPRSFQIGFPKRSSSTFSQEWSSSYQTQRPLTTFARRLQTWMDCRRKGQQSRFGTRRLLRAN